MKSAPTLIFFSVVGIILVVCAIFCVRNFTPISNVEYVIQCVDNKDVEALLYNMYPKIMYDTEVLLPIRIINEYKN